MPLVHHELCFGCGRTNLFGLLVDVDVDVDETAPRSVAGRCFIKQDHQGATPGTAHEGVLAAALGEAMALACGPDARARTIEVRFEGAAPVGAFVALEAHARRHEDGSLEASASAAVEGQRVASASGSYAYTPGD